jgi:ribosome maturation factor RimP
MKKVTELAAELAAPAIAEAGCELWDVEYVREAGTWYLRIYLDKPGGSVDVLDCERSPGRWSRCWTRPTPSRAATPLRSPPPGAERALRRPSDFARFLGSPVTVRLYKARDGRKEFAGTLQSYDATSGDVTVRVGEAEMVFAKADTALVRLRVEF